MKRQFNMLLVNAFASRSFRGNTTGVVIADDLSTGEMQNIARDLNQTETVFVEKLDRERYKTRFFTPKRELKLCGHATIATFYSLAEQGYITAEESGTKTIIQHTDSGKINVEIIYKDGKVESVYMYMTDLAFEKTDVKSDLAKALGIKESDIGLSNYDVEPKYVRCGSSSLVVPVKTKEILENIKLDRALAEKLSKDLGVVSIQVFTSEDGEEIFQRTFSPAIGIDEEMASGTSTGATLYYLVKEKINRTNLSTHIQGLEAGRESNLSAKFCPDDGIIGRIKVGGRAYVFLNGVLNIQ